MSQHDVIDRDHGSRHAGRVDAPVDDETSTYVDFLAGEFPDWDFAVDTTATWSGDARRRWVATRDGHHPQSELTAGKLHRRLSDYEERLRNRRPGDN